LGREADQGHDKRTRQGLAQTVDPTPPQCQLPLYRVGRKSAAHSAAYRAAVATNRARSAPPVAATPRATSAWHSLADPVPTPPRPKQARPNADARRSEGCTRISRRSPFACIPSYPRAFAFPLSVAPRKPRPTAEAHRAPARPAILAFAANPAGLAHHPRPRRRTAPPVIRPPKGAPMPALTAPFKPFRTHPLNREPAAKPASPAPFKPFRIDPLNREPAAKPAPTAPFKPSRIDPLNREPTANRGSTEPFKPSRTDP
jgi:hypothetical protein